MCRKMSYLTAAALLLALLSGCGRTEGHYTPPSPSPAPATQAVPEPTPDPTPEPTPEPTPTPPPYDLYQFGVPLEESEPVADDSFFDNAVFLGDSRTEGLELFGGLKHGTFHWARGMNVFRADSEDYKVFEVDGEDRTLVGTLSGRSYDAVYIMIGVNELGFAPSEYEKGLSELIDKVLAAQPEAVVYLQIMPPVNDSLCRRSKLADYITNANLAKFNEAIVRVAAEKKVVLLNTAEVYTGEDGQLPAELASDGCHFAYGAYKLWADYLRNHTIDRERYFYSRENS